MTEILGLSWHVYMLALLAGVLIGLLLIKPDIDE